MYQLGKPKEPYWLDLPRGVRVEVQPLTATLYQRAIAKAQASLRALREHVDGVKAAGGRVEDLPDLAAREVQIAESQVAFTKALAVEAITAWDGVEGPGGGPAAVTPDHVRELLEDNRINEAFVIQYAAAHEKRLAEGNASAPSPNGTSAGAPVTAKGAGKRKNRARKAGGAATASSALTGGTSPAATKRGASGT